VYSLAIYPSGVYTTQYIQNMHGIHKDQDRVLKRLNRIKGQLAGVEKMILSDTYCIDIITQTSAVKNAISSMEDEMLESHLACCVIGEKDTKKQTKMREEIIKVYKLKRK
jgi:DNA-binding FrmR family transcriptional regulator